MTVRQVLAAGGAVQRAQDALPALREHCCQWRTRARPLQDATAAAHAARKPGAHSGRLGSTDQGPGHHGPPAPVRPSGCDITQ